MTSKGAEMLKKVESIIQDQNMSEEKKREVLKETLEDSQEFRREFAVLKKAANDEVTQDTRENCVELLRHPPATGKIKDTTSSVVADYEIGCDQSGASEESQQRLSEKFSCLLDNSANVQTTSLNCLSSDLCPPSKDENIHQASKVINDSSKDSRSNINSGVFNVGGKKGIEDMLPKNRIPHIKAEHTADMGEMAVNLFSNSQGEHGGGESRKGSSEAMYEDVNETKKEEMPITKVDFGKGVLLLKEVVSAPKPHILIHIEITKCINVKYILDTSSSSNLKWRKEEYPGQMAISGTVGPHLKYLIGILDVIDPTQPFVLKHSIDFQLIEPNERFLKSYKRMKQARVLRQIGEALECKLIKRARQEDDHIDEYAMKVAPPKSFIDLYFPPIFESFYPVCMHSLPSSSPVYPSRGLESLQVMWDRLLYLMNLSPNELASNFFDQSLISHQKLCSGVGRKGVLEALASLNEARAVDTRSWFVDFDPNSSVQYGVYNVRLYLHGQPVNFKIDDFCPILSTGDRVINQGPVWMPLMEKAMAKAYGSYSAIIDSIGVAGALRDITGVPVMTYKFCDSTVRDSLLFHRNLWNKMCKFQGFPIVSSAGESLYGNDLTIPASHDDDDREEVRHDEKRLVPGAVYFVLDFEEKIFGESRKVFLVNPLEDVNTPKGGLFAMYLEDWVEKFSDVSICHLRRKGLNSKQNKDWHTNRFNQDFHYNIRKSPFTGERSVSVSTPHYRFNYDGKKSCKVFITLHQTDCNVLGSEPYIDFGLTVLKQKSDSSGEFEFVDSTLHVVERDCTLELKIKEPGCYYIIPTSTGVKFVNRTVANSDNWADPLVAPRRFESETGHSIPKTYGADGLIKHRGSLDVDSDNAIKGYMAVDFMDFDDYDDTHEEYVELNKLYLNENRTTFSHCISRIFDEVFDRFVSSSNMEDAMMTQLEMDAFARRVSCGDYGVSEKVFGILCSLHGGKRGLTKKDFKNAQFKKYITASRNKRVQISELIEKDLCSLGYDPRTLYHNNLKHVYLSVHSDYSLFIEPYPFDAIVYNAGIELPLIYKGVPEKHFGGLGCVHFTDPSRDINTVISYLLLNNSEKDFMKVSIKEDDENDYNSSGCNEYISTKISMNSVTNVPPCASKIINHILPLKTEKAVKVKVTVEILKDSAAAMSPSNSRRGEKFASNREDSHFGSDKLHPTDLNLERSQDNTTYSDELSRVPPNRNGSIQSIISIPKYRQKNELI